MGDSRLYLIGAGSDSQGDERPFAGGRDRRCGRTQRGGGDGASAAQRSIPRCRELPSPGGRGRFIEVTECELPDDAAMLLCSDGLSDHLTSRRIREIAERYTGDAEQTARNLVDAANQAGGRDNITAVFVAGPAFRGRGAATRPRSGSPASACGAACGADAWRS